MNYVYVIRSKRTGMIYVGRTSNLKRRIIEHFKGRVKSTKKMIPLSLIFYEAFLDKAGSVRREKYFKTTKGKSSLRQIIRESLLI
jgi:putative endonuclease